MGKDKEQTCRTEERSKVNKVIGSAESVLSAKNSESLLVEHQRLDFTSGLCAVALFPGPTPILNKSSGAVSSLRAG